MRGTKKIGLTALFTVTILSACGGSGAGGSTGTAKPLPNLSAQNEIQPLVIASGDEDYVADFKAQDFKRFCPNISIYGDQLIDYNSVLDLNKVTCRVTDGSTRQISGKSIDDIRGRQLTDPLVYGDRVFISEDQIAILDGGVIQVWNTNESRKVTEIMPQGGSAASFNGVEAYPGQGLLFVLGDPVTVIDTKTWQPIDFPEMFSHIYDFQFSVDGSFIVITRYGNWETQIWEASSGNLKLTGTYPTSMGAYAISSGGQYLAYIHSSGNGSLIITDAKTGALVIEKEICWSWGEMAFSPDNRYLVYSQRCEEDSPFVLQMLDIQTGQVVAEQKTIGNAISQFQYEFPYKNLIKNLLPEE